VLLPDREFYPIHVLLGDAPVLADATQNGTAYSAPDCSCDNPQERVEGYGDALRTARAILAVVYSFDAANVGDDNDEIGW
jgi:hypothetical protein